MSAKAFRFKTAELGIFKTAAASEALKGFKRSCRIIGLTRGQFSLIDLIRAILEQVGRAHVVCCTWSAGIKDAHQIKWLLDTDLIETFQIVTDRSYETRQPKYAITLTELFGSENIRVTDIHAKFVLLWNAKWKVCLRTSMNLNANRTCENFEIDADETIFAFYHSFIEQIVESAPPGWDGRRDKVAAVLDRIFNEESFEVTEHGGLKRGWLKDVRFSDD